MAKRKPSKASSRSKNISKITTSDLQKMERQALGKANKAISAIENAIAVWDASEKKPEELKLRINRLRYFHQALSNWEKRTLRDIANQRQLPQRVQRLREFSDICYAYRRG